MHILVHPNLKVIIVIRVTIHCYLTDQVQLCTVENCFFFWTYHNLVNYVTILTFLKHPAPGIQLHELSLLVQKTAICDMQGTRNPKHGSETDVTPRN